MKVQQLLEHHGIERNPFAEEDAQTDPVFKEHCIDSTYHPAWDKIFGNPREPSTSIVFGEKGSGKTAMRLQIAQHIEQFNRQHPDRRLYVIEYDDFNPFLDRFADKLARRKRAPKRAVAQWKLWDHMDAILSLGVTGLVDRILDVQRARPTAADAINREDFKHLDHAQARDLLLLSACYDQSMAQTFKSRWHRLRRALKFPIWRSFWDRAVGGIVTAAVLLTIVFSGNWSWLATFWPYLIILAGWVPWLARVWKWHWRAHSVARNLRVGTRQTHPLRQVLMNFPTADISDQPMPSDQRTDDRYELLMKLQGILRTLGFEGIVVLVDRLDEPHLINGSPELMRSFLWPMLDNKFLKHPGLGLKLLLPIELTGYIDRENRDFYQRARLDKQNMVPSLEWTAEALYDVANARIKACAAEGRDPSLRDLFDDSISDMRLLEALRSMRVPRHLFKFMYRLLVAHSNAYTDENPSWKISSDTFERTLAVFNRDQEAFDRGLRAGA